MFLYICSGAVLPVISRLPAIVLPKGVAQEFHELFPTSDMFLLPSARHFVQMDEPQEVARLILSASVESR